MPDVRYKIVRESARLEFHMAGCSALAAAVVRLAQNVVVYHKLDLLCGSASNPNTVVAPSRRPIFRRAAPFAQTILSIAVIFGLDHAQYITLLAKSITTPIDLCVSDELGGIRSITVAAIILTGIFGNISADWICRKFKIINPISKGLAIGNCAHTIGTTKTFEMGGVAVLLAGIITVFAAAVFAALY